MSIENGHFRTFSPAKGWQVWKYSEQKQHKMKERRRYFSVQYMFSIIQKKLEKNVLKFVIS